MEMEQDDEDEMGDEGSEEDEESEEDEKDFEEVFNEIGGDDDDFPRKRERRPAFKGNKAQKSHPIAKKVVRGKGKRR